MVDRAFLLWSVLSVLSISWIHAFHLSSVISASWFVADAVTNVSEATYSSAPISIYLYSVSKANQAQAYLKVPPSKEKYKAFSSSSTQSSSMYALLPVWLLVRTNLFVPSHFWTTYTNFDICCRRYVLGPKLLQWTFIEIFLLSIRSCTHKLFRRFLEFSQFLT